MAGQTGLSAKLRAIIASLKERPSAALDAASRGDARGLAASRSR
jgi:hypothetical protein